MNKNIKKFNEKTIKELEKEIQLTREEISKQQLSFKNNPPKDTNVIVKKRKQLAMMLTVLSEKKSV
jgi:ribosomal protein L29